jgi:hypothetical protein
LFIDPDGTKIIFGENTSSRFRRKATLTLIKASIVDKNTRQKVFALHRSSNIHVIHSTSATGGAGGGVSSDAVTQHKKAEPEIYTGDYKLVDGEFKNVVDPQKKAEYDNAMKEWGNSEKEAYNKMKSEGGDGSHIYLNLSKDETEARKGRGESNASLAAHEVAHAYRIDQGEVVNRQTEEDYAVDAENTYITKANRFILIQKNKLEHKEYQDQ